MMTTPAQQSHKLGLGGSTIGNIGCRLTDQHVDEFLGACIGAGVTFWDTSPYYGYGLSEERIGSFLERNRLHDEVKISTKVGYKLVAWDGVSKRHENFFVPDRPYTSEFHFDGDSLREQLDATKSRLRLGKHPITVVHIHDLDLGTSWGNSNYESWDSSQFETFIKSGYPVLAEAKKAGIIGGIGAGINQAQMISRLLDEVALDYVLPATRTTILDHLEGYELCKKCARLGVKVIAASPFVNGKLLLEGTGTGVDYSYGLAAQTPPEVISRVRAIERTCADFGVSLRTAALQFPLRLPAVERLLVGMKNIEELKDNILALNTEIPESFWQKLMRDGLIAEGL
jgi:D-threo-aldose 1-dehydrogenase